MHKPITEGRAQVFALMQFHRGSLLANETLRFFITTAS